MSRGAPATVLVAELVSSGRSAAARPAFEPGPRVPLVKGARGGADVGDLVTLTVRGRAGRVTAVHGPAASPHAALRALLASEDLARPFPRAVLEEAQALDESTVASDRGRRDLRDQRVITIDPDGAKDHDDAIAVAPEEGGATRMWVHIADVARFVAPGGPLDREAARRGNSVYVPGTVTPMLPPRLSSDLCSLRAGVDRAVVTVEMVVAADGQVGETRFTRSLIRSERALTYGDADAVLGGGSIGDPGMEADILRAAGVARALLTRRRARGALEAASSEPVVTFDGDRVASIHPEGQTPAHSLIEECMIAANEAVARYLIARGTPTVFRHHDDPAQARVELLYEQLDALGVATAPLPDGPLERPRAGPPPPRPPRRSPGTWRPAARGATPCGRSCCARCARPTTRRRRWATPGSPARHISTSPRPSGGTPTCWSTGVCSTRSDWAIPGRAPRSSPPRRTTARPPSARPRRWSGAPTTSARPSCCATDSPPRGGTRRSRAA